MTISKSIDVLVIGAGPAGVAAAFSARRAGLSVCIVDQHNFPRDKVCGDALIPDALAALLRMDALEKVLRVARVSQLVTVSAPNGRDVGIAGRVAVLPRRELDSLLLDHAVNEGVEFRPNLRFVVPIQINGRVEGAQFRSLNSDKRVDIKARWTVLATGATAQPLISSGLSQSMHTGIALRAYVKLPDAQQSEIFRISFMREICPGYGWIFPGPNNVYNVGVGYFLDSRRKPFSENLRDIWDAFIKGYTPATKLFHDGKLLGDPKGAPLRTGLRGSKRSRLGMLVCGEAIGTTYAFSGEGLGKALETGLLAGEVIAEHVVGRLVAAEPEYEHRVDSLYAEQFRAYDLAQAWLSYPWLCDVVALAAHHRPGLQRKLADILAERSTPREIFSASGVLQAMLGKS